MIVSLFFFTTWWTVAMKALLSIDVFQEPVILSEVDGEAINAVEGSAVAFLRRR